MALGMKRHWLPAAGVLGAVLVASLFTGIRREGAWIALGCYTLYAWAFALAWHFPRAVRWLLRYMGGVVIVAVYAQAIVTQGRPWNPNIMANLLLLTVPFGYRAGLPWWTFGLFALGFTGARAAWVAVILAVFVMLNWQTGDSRIRGAWWAVVALGLAVLLAVLVAMRPATVLAVRLVEYVGAARVWYAHPLLGTGPWSHRVDSLPLTVAAELGTVGLVAWAVLAVAIVRQVLRTRDNPARLAMMMWLLQNLADYTVWDIPSSMVAAAVLALLLKGTAHGERTLATSERMGSLPGRSSDSVAGSAA